MFSQNDLNHVHPLEFIKFDKMERDRTVRDLFPALVVQLERETSETPSVESNESAVSFVHDSPTPRAKALQDSVTAQGSASAAFQHSDAPRFDIAPSATTQYTSVSFDLPSLLVQTLTFLLASSLSLFH